MIFFSKRDKAHVQDEPAKQEDTPLLLAMMRNPKMLKEMSHEDLHALFTQTSSLSPLHNLIWYEIQIRIR
jgi:hypothetical protein